MTKLVMAKKIATVSTILNIIGLFISSVYEPIGTALLFIGIIGAIVSYSYGGFGNVIKAAGAIAKIGWIVAPFPMDIPVGLATFFGTIMACLFIPIIPVKKAFKEAEKVEVQS